MAKLGGGGNRYSYQNTGCDVSGHFDEDDERYPGLLFNQEIKERAIRTILGNKTEMQLVALGTRAGDSPDEVDYIGMVALTNVGWVSLKSNISSCLSYLIFPSFVPLL